MKYYKQNVTNTFRNNIKFYYYFIIDITDNIILKCGL